MAKTLPLVATPLKGPLFDFLDLDVEMAPNTPAAAALQHLARSILKPAWLQEDARSSGAPPCVHVTAAPPGTLCGR